MADRLITINIRRYLVGQPVTKRQRKAAAYIKERIAHFTKLNPENVKISQELNVLIEKHYARRMTPVKCNVKIGTDTADVLPFGVEKKIPTMVAKGEKEKKAEPAPAKPAAAATQKPKPATAPQQKKPDAKPAAK